MLPNVTHMEVIGGRVSLRLYVDAHRDIFIVDMRDWKLAIPTYLVLYSVLQHVAYIWSLRVQCGSGVRAPTARNTRKGRSNTRSALRFRSPPTQQQCKRFQPTYISGPLNSGAAGILSTGGEGTT